MQEDLAPTIEQMIEPFLTQKNAVLFDIAIHPYSGNIRIEILVDKPHGGITIQECSEINRQLGDILEEQNLISQHYVLEVCSPGLDRLLRTEKDFSRAIGKDVHIFLNVPVENKVEHEGIIKQIDSAHVTIATPQQEIQIPLANVNRAKLKVTF